MSQTVVIDGEITLKAKIDGEVSLKSLIDGDLSVMLGADGLEYESGSYTPSSTNAGFTRPFKLTHDEAPFCVMVADKSNNANVENNVLAISMVEYKNLFGITMQSNDPETVYTSTMMQSYRDSSATYPKVFSISYRENRGLISADGFTVFSEVDGANFLKDHTYEWIAVWR